MSEQALRVHVCVLRCSIPCFDKGINFVWKLSCKGRGVPCYTDRQDPLSKQQVITTVQAHLE